MTTMTAFLRRAKVARSWTLTAALAAFMPSLPAATAPTPLLRDGTPVDWWFVFKFNTKSFPACGGSAHPVCAFGGEPTSKPFSQQFVVASSSEQRLKQGSGCVGDTKDDPVGATFEQVYRGDYFFVVWNDQFYRDPAIQGCGDSCGSPWGHSKGMLAWNQAGEGMVLQVTTPSWPGSGTSRSPRGPGGNTLGCSTTTNNVLVSQHFFALRLTRGDVAEVLKALATASVVTNTHDPRLVNSGGPEEIQELVQQLGKKSATTRVTRVQLSTGVGLLAKPSALHVPPWQLVSAQLGRVPLRVATWWTQPAIDSTKANTPVECWSSDLPQPGAVEIATSGSWAGVPFGLKGGPGQNFNHAKFAVSTAGDHRFVIFGDMNQQGVLADSNCGRSQNGRGGLFYIIDDAKLADSVTKLIEGDSALVGSGQ